MVTLPLMSARKDFKDILKKMGLQARCEEILRAARTARQGDEMNLRAVCNGPWFPIEPANVRRI